MEKASLNNALNMSRLTSLNVGGFSVPMPCFFPSISSIKTNLSAIEYLQVLVALNHPLFLISAYDIFHSNNQSELLNLLIQAKNNENIVLMDSGNYESYWNKDKSWNNVNFSSILQFGYYHLSFCFDIQYPPKEVIKIVDCIETSVLENQATATGTIIPIVHAPLEILSEVVLGVARRLNPLMIAIPERLLGEGFIARMDKLVEIREKLNNTGQYYPIHLLGTGNPLSILVYSLLGADSFDGLEWCQTTVDLSTGLLYHFQQREFFEKQSPFCALKNIAYTQATLAHNLFFYNTWMHIIQDALNSGSIEALLKQYLPKTMHKHLIK